MVAITIDRADKLLEHSNERSTRSTAANTNSHYYYTHDITWSHRMCYQPIANEMEVAPSIGIGESVTVEDNVFAMDLEPEYKNNSNTNETVNGDNIDND